MISIKWSSNFLVFGCILISASICSILSITSSDDAISKTETNRDSSVDQCFSFSSKVITNRTSEYLNLLSAGVVNSIATQFETHRSVTQLVLSEMLAGDDQQRGSWDFMWNKRSMFVNLYNSFYDNGVAALGVVNKNGALLFILEDVFTVRSPFRHTVLNANNGSEYDVPGIPTRRRIGWGTVTNFTGNFANPEPQYYPNCKEWKDYPWIDMRPCYGNPGNVQAAVVVELLGKIVPPGIDNLTFTPPIPIGPYVGIICYGTYYNSKGEYMGVSYAALDTRIMDRFLQSLNIPGMGRIFTVVKEGNWLRLPVDLHLTGVSKGASGRGNSTHAQTVAAIDADDDIIRNTALYIESTYPNKYSNISDKGVFEISIPVGVGGGNETFYVLVNTFDNNRQIRWYVVTVLDREYILGEVDKVTGETKVGISASSKTISDDLKTSRMALILTIGGTAIVLLIGGYLAITTVTKPIDILKNEMASVAVMRLEDVNENRDLSMLSEVSQMQQSFIQMIQNLREYRNYIPQSVLVSSSDDEANDGDFDVKKSITSNSSEDSATRTSRSRTATSHGLTFTNAKDMMIKHRRISIAITNAIAFCAEPGGLQYHKEYIAQSLKQCTQHGGIPDSFNGDRFIMMFNGPKTCTGHPVQAAGTCLSIIGSAHYKISASVSSGTAKCGNMGCDGLKKYSVIGSVYAVAMTLERINRVLGTKLLCCPTAERDVNRSFYTRLEDQLWYPKYKGDKAMCIYSIVSEKHVAHEEWMYQLQTSEESNPTKAHNEIMQFYCTKEYELALSSIGDNTSLAQLKEKILKAIETGVNCINAIGTEFV